MKIQTKRIHKKKRDITLSFRSYSEFGDKLEQIYGNKHRGAQIAFDYWLPLRQSAIKEIFDKLSRNEVHYIIKLYYKIASSHNMYIDLFTYSCVFGFVYIIKLMEELSEGLTQEITGETCIETKKLKTKLEALTSIQSFFLEDICCLYPEDISINEYIDQLLKFDKQLSLKVGRYY